MIVVIFINFVVFKEGVSTHPDKINFIKDKFMPTMIHNIYDVHEFATFDK